MKKFFLLASLLTLFSCTPSEQLKNPEIKKAFIIGGHPVDPKVTDTSFLVHFEGGCGGSIINEKWILSAAHCEVVFPSELSAGGVDLKDPNRIKLTIKRVIIHPQFENTGWGSKNDIALIELTNPINFEKTKLSAIALATPEFQKNGGVDEGVKALVMGWGYTSYNDNYPHMSDELLAINIPIVGLERANSNESYDGVIDHTMLAAGYDKGGKDSCGGDSGGPLIVHDAQSNQAILAGVVSFGHGCGLAYKYGIYTNVAVAYNWIMETMSK